MKFVIKTTIILILLLVPVSTSLALSLPENDYPRIANLYWKNPISQEEAKQLAQWDVVVLDMQTQNTSAENIKYIRQLNHDVIILAYTTANEIPQSRLNIIEPNGIGLWHDMASGIKDQWYLKTYQGEKISYWPGNLSMNLYTKDQNNRTYASYLTDFYANKVLSSGLWDGLLFDNTWQNVYWMNNKIDIDGDHRRDSQTEIDYYWRQGHLNLFKQLRNKFGSQYLIVGNGDGLYHSYMNGRMIEGFPEYWEGGWLGSMERYSDNNENGYQSRFNIVNSDTNNTGNNQDYPTMRYGLTSTLLFDGYFSFDYGSELREQLWYYDEYDAYLGKAKTNAFNLLKSKSENLEKGLWQRDFENGLVIVNSTDQKQIINFDSEYEKIHGDQDTITNNGAVINRLTVNSDDGIILLRPIDEITDKIFVNGSFARIFNSEGKNIRTGFFAYEPKFKGSSKIIKTDMNNNGEIETIMANASKISVYNSKGRRLRTFYPYGYDYNGGISIAIADLDGDNKNEIITGPEKGGANKIMVFNWYGREINSGWHAYHQDWINLGTNVAAGDINGDGQIEIISGAGFRGGPHVKIFDKNGKLISEGFFAYDTAFRGGVNVTTGDVNGDGTSEIITGPGFGGSPHVKIFNQNGTLLNQWYAYNEDNNEGVNVVAADLDHNGIDEVIALTTNVFTTSFLKTPINTDSYAD